LNLPTLKTLEVSNCNISSFSDANMLNLQSLTLSTACLIQTPTS
jgi:Leucine-rich repeat (LRR) protein